MKNTFEKLWNEYFVDVCSVIDTEEERNMAKKAVAKHEKANEMLTEEQISAIENYVDVLCEIQSGFVKKAFLKGCQFAASFMMEFVLSDKSNPLDVFRS